MAKATYKDAGVDLEVYQDAMARLPALMHRTFSPRVMKLDGGFAGLFQLDFDNPLFSRKYEQPVLVSGTDGVGTKLKVAHLTGRHDTVGIDLVAMCVNDVICCGAEPLFFLDYVAMSHDDPERLEQIVEGVSQGCLQADCALLAGETAIMPDLYQKGEYDLAGFCVGVAEKSQLLDGKTISAGDTVIGVGSSGLHSNGFSLARKVIFEFGKFKLEDSIEQCDATVAELLLEPTLIYSALVRRVLRHYKVKHVVHGIAHITGGGLCENLERILPDSVSIEIDRNAWKVPPVFNWIQEVGEVEQSEMDRVFNMGIGLTLVVSSFYAEAVRRMIGELGYESWVIGHASEGDKRVSYK